MGDNLFPIGQRISLPGHFSDPVVIESVRAIGTSYECRVRLLDGTPDEAILSPEEAATLLGPRVEETRAVLPADAERVRLLVESARIRLAYAHDRHFAVSLSGIRTLPHQIEAVYIRMLPQPRLRFLLADDPGAGKTIMAGLLIKEMKLREAVERVLILCPAPLTIQWQDELLRWFGEQFEVIFSARDQQQIVNPWGRSNHVIASIDYAKQDGVRERVWNEKWGLVIIDEAHKCSAYTKSASGRSDEVEKTKRYQLAEKVARDADHLLLLTATPHHGDDDRFAHFIRLLDPDLFPEPHRIGNRAMEIRRDILRLGPDCPWALRRLKEDLRDLRGRRLFPDRHAHTVTFRLNREEYDLYKAVTAYINEFFPQATGRRQASAALARTVFQRRLASSTMAIYESIRRRIERQQNLLGDLESSAPVQSNRRFGQLQEGLTDGEQDEDDLNDADLDRIADDFTGAIELDKLRVVIAVERMIKTNNGTRIDHSTLLNRLSNVAPAPEIHGAIAYLVGEGRVQIEWGIARRKYYRHLGGEATELNQLRFEIASLQDLLAQAGRVRDQVTDSKLTTLQECLERAEFRELRDGRGRLLIFTEHRDTLNYLRERLETWGYSTCQIHGGMNPHERKRAQEHFRTDRQICVATEAAGEGINLQFCRLMINYDLPWNPTRLEQRLGRIHRIGQERDVHAFNFVASDSEDGHPIVEGRILERLLQKLEQMRAALDDRVFDVIGEVLSLNEVNLPEMLREAAFDPRRLDDYLDQIERMDPDRLRQYEQATGIALARANVDFSGFQQANAEAEERRLMPRYVENHFLKASQAVGLRVEPRADGLYRVEHVLADLRSDRLQAVQKLGKAEPSYRKITFHKEHLDQDQHLDAILVGPGHSLYAAVDERLNEILSDLTGGVAVYLDEVADAPYRLHFFEMGIRGQNTKGETQPLYGELVAVREDLSLPIGSPERLSVVPADVLLDLPAHPTPPATLEPFDPAPASDFLKSTYQMERRGRCLEERRHFVEVCRDYLKRSFDARIRAAQDRVMELRAREATEPDVSLARQRAENDLMDLERARRERLSGLDRLTVVRHGPVRHLATALVLPPEGMAAAPGLAVEDLDPDVRRRSEKAAEDVVVAHETARGWSCERVGHLKIGFDIRSLGPANPQTGYRDPVESLRRIEVKGRSRGHSIHLTTNEWYKATQLGDSYWLYVVWDPLSDSPELVTIQNPAQKLDHAKREVVMARQFDIPAQAIKDASR